MRPVHCPHVHSSSDIIPESTQHVEIYARITVQTITVPVCVFRALEIYT
jgi:hypothetical protein